MDKIAIKADKNGKRAEVLISGKIEPASAKQVVDDLNGMCELDEVNVRLNSLGGDLFAAMSIFDTLTRNRAFVAVEAVVAGGPAALIALAGASILMPANGYMKFPSDPISELFRGRVIEIMARRCNLPRWQIVEWLRGTNTWFTAQEALAKNLIGQVTPKANLVNFSGLSLEDGMPTALAEMIEKAVPPRPKLESFKEKIAYMKYAAYRQSRSMRRN